MSYIGHSGTFQLVGYHATSVWMSSALRRTVTIPCTLGVQVPYESKMLLPIS